MCTVVIVYMGNYREWRGYPKIHQEYLVVNKEATTLYGQARTHEFQLVWIEKDIEVAIARVRFNHNCTCLLLPRIAGTSQEQCLVVTENETFDDV